VLTDLDTVAWDDLGHAYGGASDVPNLLRGLAEGDGNALYELFGNIWHQGTVYEATAPAVPFLIELLDGPEVDVPGVLELLSAIAQGSSYTDVHRELYRASDRDSAETLAAMEVELSWARAAHDAVVAGLPVYRRLLAGSDDENVRTGAASTIAACGVDSGDATAALSAAAAGDASPRVRAAAILALRGEGGTDRWHTDPDPLPRIAAALAALSDPAEPTGATLRVLETDVPAVEDAGVELPWRDDDLFGTVLDFAGDRGDLRVRLIDGWLRTSGRHLRASVIRAAESTLNTFRPAIGALAPALAAALGERDLQAREAAAGALAAGGRAVAAVADDVWAHVDDGGNVGRHVLTTLARLHDPRVDAALAERLAARPPDLSGLDGALAALGPWATACRDVIAAAIPLAPAGNERIATIAAAAQVGVPAGELVAVLRGQCDSHPHICATTLADLGAAAAPARPELEALTGHDNRDVRLNAQRALWRITGDPTQLTASIRGAIDGSAKYRLSGALALLPELGDAAADLVDLLPPLFDSDDEWVALHAAVAYWHLTGDAGPVVPVLLPDVRGVPRGFVAVRCLAGIGPAAGAAVPALREAVESEYRQVAYVATDEWIWRDEEWMDLCAGALRRIQVRPA